MEAQAVLVELAAGVGMVRQTVGMLILPLMRRIKPQDKAERQERLKSQAAHSMLEEAAVAELGITEKAIGLVMAELAAVVLHHIM